MFYKCTHTKMIFLSIESSDYFQNYTSLNNHSLFSKILFFSTLSECRKKLDLNKLQLRNSSYRYKHSIPKRPSAPHAPPRQLRRLSKHKQINDNCYVCLTNKQTDRQTATIWDSTVCLLTKLQS